MDRGNIGLDVLGEELANDGRQAWVRAMFRRSGAGWELAYAWALIGGEPPGWVHDAWHYEQLAFVSGVISAGELGVLASPAVPGALAVGGMTGSVPAATGPAAWTRRPSFASHDSLPLPWPVTEYSITSMDQDRQLPGEVLAGPTCPSFPEPNSAWRAFFNGDFSLNATHGIPHHLAVVRRVEDAAWLGHVEIRAASLTADICGTAVQGCELELYGITDRASCTLGGPGPAAFTMERGLPQNCWLWLKRGTRWLDYRVLDPRSAWAGEAALASVGFDLPSEPQASLQVLLAAGEGPDVEYKRQLPETAHQKRTVFKTVAAFATGAGGVIVFGMDPDEATVTGLSGEPRKLRDQLYDLVRQVVIPPLDVTVDDYQHEGKIILVLTVEPGPAPPYAVVADKGSRDKPEFYIRRGASTFPAQPTDLRDAARARPAATDSHYMTRFGAF